MNTVHIPGVGEMTSNAYKVDDAVNTYDERLSFRRNPETGDWCIYIATGHGIGVPVLGFGKEIPDPVYAIKRVIETDSRRHGEEILKRVERANQKVIKVREDKASDASGQLAEGIEWARRKLGTHPSPRIFIPRSI